MATTIQTLCSDLALSCGQRNRFFCNSASSAPPNFVTFKSLSFSATLSQSVVSNIKGRRNLRSAGLFKLSGSLSLSAREGSIRHCSVICMAKKYAPNTTKRKRLGRKRGGNPGKKKRTRRKGGKKDFKIVRLSSAAGTGFFYAKKKSKNMTNKIELQKYDPLAKRHVLFKEVK